MSDLDFYQTRAGRQYYEKTLPELVEQVRRLADAVERLAVRLEVRESNDEV